ncbi:hypothetical protein ACSSV5_000513 [Psychroflexus sp. MBR-150]|jgi:hypothetical protein
MKNLKYTLVMIFVSLFSVYAQEENKSITMNITGRYIAEGMCGKSIGACVKSIESVDNQNSKSADYTLYFILPQNYFNQEDIEAIKDESKQFDFIVEEDVTMLDETLRQHNIPTHYNTVKSGPYPVTFINDKYSILVTLKTSKK